MSDTIRIDLYELYALSKDLCKLSEEIEELGVQLKSARYKLYDTAQEAANVELVHIQRRLFEIGERSEAVAHRIARSAEQFASCEENEKRQFENRMTIMPRSVSMFSRDAKRKRREYLSFTPENVHSVRMSVSGGDERI